MAGGSQAYLMLGDDGKFWVVKFQNNPQHLRVLANEFIVSTLASAAGLNVPEFAVIEVTPWLAAESRNLIIDFGKSRYERCLAGLHFGSRLVPFAFDSLDTERLCQVANLREFAGFLALDKWTNNRDTRQAVFSRSGRQTRYRASFIDHGYCFAGETDVAHKFSFGSYPRNTVYAGVKGWSSFSPWIETFEEMSADTLCGIVDRVPDEWLGADVNARSELVSQLVKRQTLIRAEIWDFKMSGRRPFPNWTSA